MTDRGKKESTPPHLLLMPADSGLTLESANSLNSNMFMPVVPRENLVMAEEDGEADSFIGQTPPPTAGAYFQQSPSNSSDAFSQVGSQSFTPLQHATDQGHPFVYTPGLPPSNVRPPLPVSSSGTSAGTNIYRQQGRPRYATLPTSSPAQSPITSYVAASTQEPAFAPSPFTPAFPGNQVSGQIAMTTQAKTSIPPQTQGIYQPVQMHWCYHVLSGNKDLWRPFSLIDSLNLEEAFTSNEAIDDVIVRTDGGRYDVSVTKRHRWPVYWNEPPSEVRRCSWFYKRESDGNYIPYSEQFSQKLEIEYENAVVHNVWHKRLEFDDNETIVMHNPNVIVHFHPSTFPDEWGTVPNVPTIMGEQMRPRVVKRGVEDFEKISDGEAIQVDHLVFVVHGIGAVCDMKLRSIVECVDDFRTISLTLLKSHFKSDVAGRRIGRVEFLPVHWHSALHSQSTGIDHQLQLIMLRSTAKLREFVNDTLLDVLFYTSPTFCQTICDTVTCEMNRLYDLFRVRNPLFQGSVSVIGHSLGSSILFDILSNQLSFHQSAASIADAPSVRIPSELEPTKSFVETDSQSYSEDECEKLTLEQLLEQVGISDKLPVFRAEQIDMETIDMCTENDLKDLGIPMGPRKKMIGLLRDVRKKNDDRDAETAQMRQREKSREISPNTETDSSTRSPDKKNSITVEYIPGVAGTGQPFIKYKKLNFSPLALFALGSPIGIFMTVRGISQLGENYHLPTCSQVYNIFHPFDPVAYRLEPLINPDLHNVKPELIPHHKGRKRLHLELKDSLTRVGADLKQRIVSTLKQTWNSFNEFARAHREGDRVLEKEVDEVVKEIVDTTDQIDLNAPAANYINEDNLSLGTLNGGERVDYVLQEAPIESFNDYLFALASHLCYWESEDTVLLVLRKLYASCGVYPSTGTVDTPFKPISPLSSPSTFPNVTSPDTSVPSNMNEIYTPFMSQDSSQDASQSQIGGPPPLAGFIRTK